MLDQQRVRELLHYDPETGLLTWRVSPAICVKAGDRAGWLGSDGYWRLTIARKKYLVSRVIWLYMTGDWPKAMIDHRDKERANNRWHNLREATHSQNEMNKGMRGGRRQNVAGYKGVYWSHGKWTAEIRAGGVRYRLGRFSTKEAAGEAYREAAHQLHPLSARKPRRSGRGGSALLCCSMY